LTLLLSIALANLEQLFAIRDEAAWQAKFAIGAATVSDSSYNCIQSACSLFEEAMRINDRLFGFPPRQTLD
jgi:hypothetical protein